MTRVPSEASEAGLCAIASGRGRPLALWPRQLNPRTAEVKVCEAGILEERIEEGGTSGLPREYGHVHSTMVPFLRASRGSPAPTCHNCTAFWRTVRPASRAECTSSIHVLRT